MIWKNKSMWDGHLGRITVAKHHIVLNPLDESPIYSVPYRADPKQRELEREKLRKRRR